MTPKAARTLVDIFEVDKTLNDEEETEMLAVHNPELLDAMRELAALAEGDEEDGL